MPEPEVRTKPRRWTSDDELEWSRDELLKLLDVTANWAKLHHDALWEEEKHYAWWLSVIFPSMAVVLAASDVTSGSKQLVLGLGSVVGLLLSIYALQVVRREGVYLREALHSHWTIVHCLGIDNERELEGVGSLSLWPVPTNELGSSWEQVRSDANLSWATLLTRVFKPTGLSIRALFQLTFLLFSLAFLGVGLGVVNWVFTPFD